MKAVAYRQPLPISHADSLIDIELPDPVATGRDLLVEVKAVSVNPLDTKVRTSMTPPAGTAKVLGWDAAGIVRAVGSEVTFFAPGDRVFYAGTIDRPGCNSELHLVDERLVGRMPNTLDFAEAAALPLTTLTAWELLFDRLRVPKRMDHDAEPGEDAVLIVGAAGGVGSMLVQLARRLTALRVVGTASRPETDGWVTALGAHHVIDHRKPLSDELKRIGHPLMQHIVSMHTEQHLDEIVASIAPLGQFALIDNPKTLDAVKFQRKGASLHWEIVFARPLHRTRDMEVHRQYLDEVAALVDAGVIRTTVTERVGRIGAENLKRAHARIEQGSMRGKLVLEGF